MTKTNAMRLMAQAGIPIRVQEYEVDESDLSGLHAAEQLGMPPEQIFKTLVARGDRTGVLMACLPGSAELDLKALAQASGNKHVEMVQLKEVQPLTGYVRGGCSPLGAKKAYPVFVDESAMLWDEIYVSAGHRGVQLKLAPDDLLRACQAGYAPLARMPQKP